MDQMESYCHHGFLCASFFLRNSIELQISFYSSLTPPLIPSWQAVGKGKLFVEFNNLVSSCPFCIKLTARKPICYHQEDQGTEK